MARFKDLSPKMSGLRSAEQELQIPFIAGERPMGQSMGGLQMYSNSFKRGYGNAVFGADDNGLWLGAADFADAPIKLYKEGAINISNGDSSSEITAEHIKYSIGATPVIFIGE